MFWSRSSPYFDNFPVFACVKFYVKVMEAFQWYSLPLTLQLGKEKKCTLRKKKHYHPCMLWHQASLKRLRNFKHLECPILIFNLQISKCKFTTNKIHHHRCFKGLIFRVKIVKKVYSQNILHICFWKTLKIAMRRETFTLLSWTEYHQEKAGSNWT